YRWSTALERAIRDHHATALRWQYAGDGLERLQVFADQLEVLHLSDRRLSELSSISALRNLVELQLEGNAVGIEFSKLRRLVTCSIESRVLARLPKFPASLKELDLVGCPVQSLAGFHAPKLDRLRVTRLRRLRSVSELSRLRALRHLELSMCRQVSDLS